MNDPATVLAEYTKYFSQLQQETAKTSEELWLDELDKLVKEKPPFFYSNDRLGSPKFENGILEICFKKAMTPQEALQYWKNYS